MGADNTSARPAHVLQRYALFLRQVSGVQVLAPGTDKALLVQLVHRHHRMRHGDAIADAVIIAFGHYHSLGRNDVARVAVVMRDITHLPLYLLAQRVTTTDHRTTGYPKLPDSVVGKSGHDAFDIRAAAVAAIAPGGQHVEDEAFLFECHETGSSAVN